MNQSRPGMPPPAPWWAKAQDRDVPWWGFPFRWELADLEQFEAERLELGWHALQRRAVQTRYHPRESVPAPSGSRAGVTGVSGRVNRFRWPGARRRVPRGW
jgi:hypothetical protein